jgi:hypothetical protein
MPTVTRLTSNGVFQTIGGLGSFDEISLDSGSINFKGTEDYLKSPTSSAFAFETGDFTMEAWVYPNSVSGTRGVVSTRIDISGSTNQVFFGIDGGTVLYYSGIAIQGGTIIASAWSHIACSRQGTTVRVFLNGVVVASSTDANSKTTTFGYIGAGAGDNSQLFAGYISNARFIKGTALYTANFTPPTAPLTPVANTSLLLTVSPQNPYLDSSNNNFTMTRNGTPRFNSIGPFYYPGNTSINLANTNNNPVLGSNTNIVTSTTSNGVVMVTGEFDEVSVTSQSLLFDGSTGYLSVPSINGVANYGSGDYTFEAWAYKNNTGLQTILASFSAGGLIIYPTTTVLTFNISASTILTDTDPFPLLQWVHVAVTRSSGTLRLFVNGTQKASTSNSTIPSNDIFYVGMWADGTSFKFNGYISNVRIVKGTALYTSNFIPPKTVLSPVENTSLLLNNFVDKPFVDNSLNNLPITVVGGVTANTLSPFGNAQRKILNTGTMMVKEYDEVSMTPGSLRFDGSTGYLSVPYSSNFEFGNGDFTIEFWMYSSGINIQGLMSFPHNAGNYGQVLFFGGSSSALTFYSSSDGINWDVANASSLGNINLNAWNHIAVSKSGSSIRTFLNGVLQATITFAGTFAGSYDRCWIGDTAQNSHYNGLFSNIRVVKGTALYTANFTPPTTALTAIANTVLLLNTTTAQPFVDNSSNNLTITVNGGVTANTFTPF